MMQLVNYAVLLSLGFVLEASAYPKPGNVHRLKDFIDTRFEDFLITGVSAVSHLYKGVVRGFRYFKRPMSRNTVGDIIYGIVKSSVDLSGGGNTSLGSALLIVPLSLSIGFLRGMGKLKPDIYLITNTAKSFIEKHSTVYDSIMLYKAIRYVSPSYIKKHRPVNTVYPDVWSPSYRKEIIEGGYRLWDILAYSSRYDMVAKEVVEGYIKSIELVNHLDNRLKNHRDWNRAIVETYLYLLSNELDTLIIRKCSVDIAKYVMEKAKELYRLCIENWDMCLEDLKTFDYELHKENINPGSTADIVASSISLYALYREKKIIRV
jgi:triphosphoribosyl-dephospho-CoA synthase